jgi:nucleotidyltransferase/DNA polymerase involved in DNA repair
MTDRVAILFFDMNSFFASVAQAEEPALMGRAVGVLTTDAPGAACIAASIEAKRLGVGMGTRQEEARQLCPGIQFRAVKHDVCVDYHHAVRRAVETVLPIERAFSIDEFSCKLMGSQQEMANAVALGRRLQAAILAQVSPALRCSVGLAPNKMLAKVAAGFEKPGGLHWILPHILPDRIAHLALDGLPGISHAMKARLEAAGIMDVRSLFGCDPKRARAIWGSVAGERFVRELRGEVAIWPETQRGMFGHGQVLTGANRSPEGARLVARRLLVKAAARLRREGYFARSLSVGVKCATHGRQGRDGEIQATQDTFFLLETFGRYWARLRVTRPLSVQVTLGGLVPVAEYIPDLFAAQASKPRADLCGVIDQLNRRYGQDSVRFGQLPHHRVPYTGAKIAFGRIPVWQDFLE